jgi:antirestriction protein ArdC
MFDIYAAVTDRIIAAMEEGTIPWHKPWAIHSTKAEKVDSRLMAVNHISGKPYSLLNQMLLGRPGEYVSFKQCREAGGKVKKGEKSSMVVFWKMIDSPETDKDGKPVIGPDGKQVVKTIPVLKYFNVFHIDQCEGIRPKHEEKAEVKDEKPSISPLEAGEKVINDYVSRSGVKFSTGVQDSAFYRPSADMISIPHISQYKEAAEYYSTAFHEMVHSTGHKSRLDRLDRVAAFGSDDYSKEELVAEIGSAAICNRVGIETKSTFRNSVAYLQNWLAALKNDKKLIVSAASRADKAVCLIMND